MTKKFKRKKDPHAEREAQKYQNPIPSREFILDYLAERGRPANYQQIQTELGIQGAEQEEALRRRLIAMTRDGQLLKNRKGAYGPLSKMELIAGRVIGHKDGFGFVEPDDPGEEDLFLSPRQMRNVFHGDRVLARISNIDNRGRREAVIVEVLEQNTQQLVGRYYEESGAAFVEPTNKRVHHDILIPPDENGGAENGQMVVVAITAQPTAHTRPLGKVVEILGDHMAPGMEIKVAIRNHELPYLWPDDVSLEASRFPAEVQEEDLEGRTDYRHLPLVTIDGEDAKDFDDAVYCAPRDKGGWLLYVAIADVGHYVRPGSALDREAYKRGNSVYFPGRVIPMLPEALSNNLCSLNPNVDRLAMVCEMTIHPTGRIMRYQFNEGVIKSHARLTYTQVHAMMEKNDNRMRERFKPLLPHLTHLYDLFRTLHKARQARGAIDFDLPETKIVFGKDRKIEKIVPYERYDSHRVIEECMLSANISAARFLEKNKQSGLYRVHEGPTEEKLHDLRRFLNEMGLKMPGHRKPVPADYAHILRVVKDRPDAHLIQTVLLRSMSQAVYDPDNRGHFGLAFEAYTHFTSPIRRYPDLLVHRVIKQVLSRKPSLLDEASLNKAGEHCSMTERRADDATSEVSDWLKCEFMMDKVGQEFSGVISGVTGFGFFVELADIYVEGLVHMSTLPNDYYQFDAIKHTITGERNGRRFRLGDSVKVQVARVDLDECKIDFVLAGEPPRSETKAKGRRPQAKKGKKTKKKKQKR
ncbi:ribonuclease R [Aquicella lusitana]|uniref:Ribonuclease R n=1 Tax=Aquicella lusitana TaxID=254246 RepID=A0A370H3D1_9COXI|nr:ribonuclease R [Aquicella lusitana]RDI48593.1 RNAse R [Aquicella lusitana]VVC74030.1 Ribonuclease R [Aquicella lusitana]